jgi:biopolymer transport protein ExbD
MRFPRNARIFRGQLDASPFVGVLFLVAIFLLLNSSLVFMPGVAIKLPEAADFPGVTNLTVSVAVDRAGQLYYENEVINEEKLRMKLREVVRQIKEPVTLVFLADQSVTYAMFVRLCQLARDAEVSQVLFSTRPPGGTALDQAVR